jgi:hypothetical protein
VVGVAGKEHAAGLAEALSGDEPRVWTGVDRDKPFARMDDKHVMYVERIGCVPVHDRKRLAKMRAAATRRATHLTATYIDMDLEVTPKKGRR